MQKPARSRPNVDSRFRLSVTYRPIAELKPDPANPRLHSKKQIRQIANSIREFGFVTPVLIDRDGKVLAGHGRLLACHELGITEVPTVCLDHLTPAQARVFMIADNRLTEIATWDDQLLAEQLKELSLLDLDFSIELTGFEMGEIDPRIASLEDMADPANDPADAVPELPARTPLSKYGDLYILCHHRVLCGSALDPADFATLMAEEARCYGLYRPALQCADRRSREWSRCNPPSPLPDGIGRDGQSSIHRLSQSSLSEPRRV
jgi:hypothetical protein